MVLRLCFFFLTAQHHPKRHIYIKELTFPIKIYFEMVSTNLLCFLYLGITMQLCFHSSIRSICFYFNHH